jgi:hypothetical protein
MTAAPSRANSFAISSPIPPAAPVTTAVFSISNEFAREGAAVIISDVNEQAGKEAAARLTDEGCEAVLLLQRLFFQ